MNARAHVDFVGERFELDPGKVFEIGRLGDLSVDDNPYLHRRLLSAYFEDGLWWLANVGHRIPVTVAEAGTGFQALLAPGSRLPMVYRCAVLVFSAGPTTYELDFCTEHPAPRSAPKPRSGTGEVTKGAPSLTNAQLAMILALAEPLLLREGCGSAEIPSSVQAAKRLGWPITTFNRKLDNVCEKLDQLGVKGLLGVQGKVAMNRRVRLVEFAIASRLVTRQDLALLPPRT